MATGRSNQLTKQVGEYLVACELARQGLVVATFSGNVPDFDLIATDKNGSSVPIQVKTVRGGAWQFSIDKFCDITLKGNRQIIGKKKRLRVPHLLTVFVFAAEQYGGDKFFILKWSRVQDIIIKNHTRWLDAHGGVRPNNPSSMHTGLSEHDLQRYRDNWELIFKGL